MAWIRQSTEGKARRNSARTIPRVYELGQDLLGEKVEVLGLAEEFRVVGRDEVDEVVDLVSAGR